MAKSATADQTIYFKAVPWSIGDKSGLYSQVMKNEPVKNLDVAKEVVDTRRMPHSPDEALNVFKAFMDVMTAKTGTDLRPRVVDGYIKTDIASGGELPTAKSPWDKLKNWCKVSITLLKDSTKVIDGTFRNIETSDIPKLNFVTALDSDIQNRLIINTPIVAYGDKMQFSAELGDTAYLKHGEDIFPLTCTASDVAHAQFEFPAAVAAIPAGEPIDFHMNSRGGVNGAVATPMQKTVVLAPYAGTVPLITAFNQGDLEEGTFHCNASEWVTLKGAGFRSLNIQSLKVGHRSGNTYDKQINATEVSIVDDNTMRFKLPTNNSTMTDEELREADLSVTLYTQSAISAAYSLTYVG